jgi:hypothetical protein
VRPLSPIPLTKRIPVPDDMTIAHPGVDVPDLPALDRFLAEVVGLLPGGPPDGETATWRDAAAHRLIVRPGPAGDADFVTDTWDDDRDDDRSTAWGHQPQRQR